MLLIVCLLFACSEESTETTAVPSPSKKQSTPEKDRGAGPPVARIEDVKDVYHGVAVSDPYRCFWKGGWTMWSTDWVLPLRGPKPGSWCVTIISR